MAHTRLITLNASGGAFVAVSATQVTRRVEIIEDGSANGGTGQGLAYQFNDGSATPFTTTYTIEPQSEPIVLSTPVPQGGIWTRARCTARSFRRIHTGRDAAHQLEVGECEYHDRAGY